MKQVALVDIPLMRSRPRRRCGQDLPVGVVHISVHLSTVGSINSPRIASLQGKVFPPCNIQTTDSTFMLYRGWGRGAYFLSILNTMARGSCALETGTMGLSRVG